MKERSQSMNANNDRCSRLRQLHEHLVQEIQELQKNVYQEEREGVENPVETVSIIKSLQSSLQTIELELQKCV
jgi:hypothetical protein